MDLIKFTISQSENFTRIEQKQIYMDLTNIPNRPVRDIVVPAQQFSRPGGK